MSGFEGSYLGDAGRLPADATLECGICWHVYEPAMGDPVWSIDPGTPFSALPDWWRCPNCDAEKSKFMVIGDAGAAAVDDWRARVSELQAAYRLGQERLRGLPAHNPALEVEAIGFQCADGRVAGVIAAPSFLNIVAFSADPSATAPTRVGDKRALSFPSGEYEFVMGELPGFGWIESCSLISPVLQFPDQAAIRAAAQAAVEELFTAQEPQAAPVEASADAGLSRRALFGRTG